MQSTLNTNLPRNYFDLSQNNVFTMEVGKIYPIYQMLCMPGDLIEVQNQAVLRQVPTYAPSFSNFKFKTFDVVVAIRALDKDFFNFLRGCQEYDQNIPYLDPLPRWTGETADKRAGTLWDYLENPINCLPTEDAQQLDYFRQAYGFIWEWNFRNRQRQDSILEEGVPGSWKGEELLSVNWDRDYFTTSLPSQQLGEPFGIALTGLANVDYNNLDGNTWLQLQTTLGNNVKTGTYTKDAGDMNLEYNMRVKQNEDVIHENVDLGISIGENQNKTNLVELLNKGKISFENASTILISQLRETMALQSMAEINQLCGITNQEFSKAHWGVAPTNEELLLPVVFGKNVMNIITSAISQTSQTTENSQLGELAGEGTAWGESGKDRYYCKEPVIYLKLAYVKPDVMYANQGAKKEYTQKVNYDFPFPMLQHLSPQPIRQQQLVCTSKKYPQWNEDKTDIEYKIVNKEAETLNSEIIGYTMIFDEYREKQNRINGMMQMEIAFKNGLTTPEEMTLENTEYLYNSYNWNEARYFPIDKDNLPKINNDFLKCEIDNRNHEVQKGRYRYQFICWHRNNVNAWRTLSLNGLPSNMGIVGGI